MTTLAPGTGRSRHPGRSVHAPLEHREVHAVNSQIQYMLAVHADRIARLHAESRRANLARSTRIDSRRIRRALGRSLVRAGQRIAAETSAPDRQIEHLLPAGPR